MQSMDSFDILFTYVQRERMTEAARERLAAQVRTPRPSRSQIDQAVRPVLSRLAQLAAVIRSWYIWPPLNSSPGQPIQLDRVLVADAVGQVGGVGAGEGAA